MERACHQAPASDPRKAGADLASMPPYGASARLGVAGSCVAAVVVAAAAAAAAFFCSVSAALAAPAAVPTIAAQLTSVDNVKGVAANL